MKKHAALFVVVVISIMITKVCAQQMGKKLTNPKKTVPSKSYALNLSFDEGQSYALHPDILGVNTGWTFREAVDKDPGFSALLKQASPGILRFPGGTVANYYHPDAPGYGFKEDEILPMKALHPLFVASQDMNENILEPFIRMCLASGARATFCANLLTGTPEEALTVIRRIKAAGVPLDGVELGNEFNLMMYRDEFPNADGYIQQAKMFALAIKQEFPELPVGVIMGDEVYLRNIRTQRGNFQHTWSTKLAAENFFDAVVVHYYPKCTKCGSPYLEEFFQNSWSVIAPYKTHYLDSLAVYANTFFPGKKVWITEWNTGDWNTFDNTYLQAAFTGQFLMKLAEGNIRHENIFQIVNYHFLGPDGLIYKSKGSVPPLETSGKYSPSSAFYPFTFYTNILEHRGGRLIDSKLDNPAVAGELALQTFVTADSAIVVYYVNSSNNKYTVRFSKTPVVYNLEYVNGGSFSSVAGKTYFEQNYPTAGLIRMKKDKKTYKGTEFLVDAYSVGYVEFKTGK